MNDYQMDFWTYFFIVAVFMVGGGFGFLFGFASGHNHILKRIGGRK
jgi:hypothetical protein